MAVTEINWEDAVGLKTVTDGGHIGDLMTISRAHIDAAVEENRITQEQAGEIYTAMIPAAIQSGIEFTMTEQMQEANTDKIRRQTI